MDLDTRFNNYLRQRNSFRCEPPQKNQESQLPQTSFKIRAVADQPTGSAPPNTSQDVWNTDDFTDKKPLWSRPSGISYDPDPGNSGFLAKSTRAGHLGERPARNYGRPDTTSESPDGEDSGSLPMIEQPEMRPISQESLIAEVKGIYAGLVMVESKCIDVDNARNAQNEASTKLNNEQWQALIALHRTLLHEHHEFFLAAQHPSASPALHRLANKYARPSYAWRHGVHSFLELLRYRLPAYLEHMLTFIYLAYSMMALLFETVQAFEDTWIECLADLGRYRIAIDDEVDDIGENEVWTSVSRHWYTKAKDKAPRTGPLYHHLAKVLRVNAVRQLFYYQKSLCILTTYSLLTLLDTILCRFRIVAANTRPPGNRVAVANSCALLEYETGGNLTLSKLKLVMEDCSSSLKNLISSTPWCSRQSVLHWTLRGHGSDASQKAEVSGLLLQQHNSGNDVGSPNAQEMHCYKTYDGVKKSNIRRQSIFSQPHNNSTFTSWLPTKLRSDTPQWSLDRCLRLLISNFRVLAGSLVLFRFPRVAAAPLQIELHSDNSTSPMAEKVIGYVLQIVCIAIAMGFNFSGHTKKQKRQMNAIAMGPANYVTLMLASNVATSWETIVGSWFISLYLTGMFVRLDMHDLAVGEDYFLALVFTALVTGVTMAALTLEVKGSNVFVLFLPCFALVSWAGGRAHRYWYPN